MTILSRYLSRCCIRIFSSLRKRLNSSPKASQRGLITVMLKKWIIPLFENDGKLRYMIDQINDLNFECVSRVHSPLRRCPGMAGTLDRKTS
jgi:hypothetical protein